MNSKNIEKIIKKIIGNASYKAILIDAPCNVGKNKLLMNKEIGHIIYHYLA